MAATWTNMDVKTTRTDAMVEDVTTTIQMIPAHLANLAAHPTNQTVALEVTQTAHQTNQTAMEDATTANTKTTNVMEVKIVVIMANDTETTVVTTSFMKTAT